ncbi:outer membrane protein assembly factor BamD, partial [Burkholderia pseudomallei]
MMHSTKRVANPAAAWAVLAAAAALVAGCPGLPQTSDGRATGSSNNLYSGAQAAFTGGDWAKCPKDFQPLQGGVRTG